MNSKGVKEITLIAQDTTRYGTDIYDKSCRAEHLLKEIAKIEEIKVQGEFYDYRLRTGRTVYIGDS